MFFCVNSHEFLNSRFTLSLPILSCLDKLRPKFWLLSSSYNNLERLHFFVEDNEDLTVICRY